MVGATQYDDKVEGPFDVPLHQLSFGLSPRFVEVDAAHVALLGETLEDLPPILVTAGDLVVIDGVHRTVAARRAGRQFIAAYMFYGDRDEAFARAVASNVRHGRPLTARERAAAARRFLESRSDWSDRRVAALCGLSPSTVTSMRRSSDKFDHLNATIGRDGRVRPRDPAAQRLRIADELARDPKQSLRDIAARTGASPATVLDVRSRLARGEDPLPRKLQRESGERASSSGSKAWKRDDAFDADADHVAFADWFERTCVRDDDWRRHVDAVPLSRVYEVIDEANTRARSWSELAAALNKRAARRS